MSPQRFDFEFSGIPGLVSRALGVNQRRARVEVTDDDLVARYGPWLVRTPRSNIAEVRLTGPYARWKVAGPPRLSFADGGLTFATNSERGVCIRFYDKVPGIEPTGHFRHPGLTVTVANPEALAAALAS